MRRIVPWMERKRKGRRRNPNPKQIRVKGGKKKDLSIIKCFHCHEFKHYATKCPQKKSRMKTVGGVSGEALDSQFELDFILIACMERIVMSSVWYLDNNASFHMMGNK